MEEHHASTPPVDRSLDLHRPDRRGRDRPATVYAAASSTVAIGNPTGTATAKVTLNHQLLTTPIDPGSVVYANGVVTGPCKTLYTPPAGKALVVTDITLTVGSGVEGTESFGGFFAGSACTGNQFDQYDGVKKFDTLQHAYPTGIPAAAVSGDAFGGTMYVFLHGYLIPVGQLPHAVAPASRVLPKAERVLKG